MIRSFWRKTPAPAPPQPLTRKRQVAAAELRNAALVLDGPGARAAASPQFVACVAILLRHHAQRISFTGEIDEAARLLARVVNQQASRHCAAG